VIWDDIRKVAPVMRHPDIQVIKVPYYLVCPQADCSKENWEAFIKMIPMRDEHVDGSWIRPPFKRFVIVSQYHDDSCIYVEAHTPGARSGDPAWRDGEQWSFNSAFYLNTGKQLGIVGHGSAAAGADGLVRSSSHADAESVMIQEALKLEAASRGIPTIPVPNTNLYGNLVEYMTYCVVVAMALMSCKNVERSERQPARQLRRAAERSGLPLVSWHELVLSVPGTSQAGSGSGAGTGEALALHFVRGHFKDLRLNGLFGKHKGVYWWGPHLAGRADRTVLKNYSLVPVR
jgi:hypothetical protein